MKIKPDPNKEYVLVYDHPPKGEVLVPQDTIVTNVHLSDHKHFMGGDLEFTVKATGEKFHTHYGYMFAENNEANLEKLTNFRQKRDEYFAAKERMNIASKEVDMVLGPFEGL